MELKGGWGAPLECLFVTSAFLKSSLKTFGQSEYEEQIVIPSFDTSTDPTSLDTGLAIHVRCGAERSLA